MKNKVIRTFEEGWVLAFTVIIFTLSIYSLCYAKTLVKYNKNTGDIIQTNTVDKMPSADILADRFKSATTDVLLYDGEVDISKQRVDLNTKGIIDIPKKELDDAAKEVKDKKDKLVQDRASGIEKIKKVVMDLTTDEIKALWN